MIWAIVCVAVPVFVFLSLAAGIRIIGEDEGLIMTVAVGAASLMFAAVFFASLFFLACGVLGVATV